MFPLYFLLKGKEEEPFDHTQCSDCSLVYGMGNDCLMHLAATQHIASEASRRLMKLLELRERVSVVCLLVFLFCFAVNYFLIYICFYVLLSSFLINSGER
jgi:hypothetical protein